MVGMGQWEMSENDRILSSLLGCVDGAIEDVKAEFEGAPLHVVETELARVLAAVIPSAKFDAGDIRSWAAAISS
ncbi:MULTISPECIES: hypothetical protein [unclassified Arthrobacter]|uniref:hypothetical protein n=1 Tax=unclassified Arthrobacter TaxID=235627 RepID=UPI001C856484|nr:hypothetical protein [Arthrobacter sp. MAHUQ-56]MBX7443356.1 hypothetical protein [Arthrobacter sp. MAHUQ-56]